MIWHIVSSKIRLRRKNFFGGEGVDSRVRPSVSGNSVQTEFTCYGSPSL